MSPSQLELPWTKNTTLDAMRCGLLGTSLIEASAGTGKTYAITTLYVRLILERNLSVAEVLVVTYTRAATAELRDRIRRRLRTALLALEAGHDEQDPEMNALAKMRADQGTLVDDTRRLREALRSFDQSSIFTIHGFCQRVLQDSAFESGTDFDTEFLSDQSDLVTEIVNDFWAREMYGADPGLVRFLMGASPGVKPALLANLAHKVTQDPTMPILPALDEATANTAMMAWKQTRDRAAALWTAEREAVVALLDGNPDLKQNMYRPGQASGPWARSMDLCLAEHQLGIPKSFAAFVKFTPAGIAAGTKKGGQLPEHDFFDLCKELLDISAELSRVSMSVTLRLVRYARSELAARKQSLSLQSYDDLLFRLSAALEGKGGPRLAESIRTRYPGALIDEFQDTDPLQYKIFESVYGGEKASVSLFLIGDPKQAIYGFRGADVFAYMAAREDAGDSRHAMGTNWRSDPRLIQAVNSVFTSVKDAFVFDAIAFEPVTPSARAQDWLETARGDDGALQIVFVESESHGGAITKGWADRHIPAWTANAIATFLASGARIRSSDGSSSNDCLTPVRPGDIAVLVRKNYQASLVQDALRELGVPSVIESDASVFESDEAAQLGRVLQAVANPTRGRAVVSALTTSILGVTGDQASLLRSDEEDWEGWLAKFRLWHKRWEEAGFIQSFRMLLGEEGVPERLLATIGGDRQLTNLYHLGELLQAKSAESKLGPHGLVRWMHRMRTDVAARSDQVGDSSKMRLESDADAVKLVTIHKSKGLEYPIVYCPYLWDGALLSKKDKHSIRFHDPGADDRLTLDIGGEALEEHRGIAEREALAENLRLLYVALTRAKHRCTLVWGGFSGSEHSPLAYLWHHGPGTDTSVAGLSAAAAHAKALDDKARLLDLTALVDRSQASVSVQHFQRAVPVPYVGEPAIETALQPRVAARSVRALGRFSSFSALVSGGRSEGQERDIDRKIDHALVPGDEADSQADEETGEVALAEFPKGARIGVMMHEVFENTDFAAVATESLDHAAAEAFARYGIGEDPAKRFVPAMRAALETPLFSERVSLAPRLAAIGNESRLNELEFLFPVHSQGKGLSAEAIAAVLRTHPNPPWPSTYPAEVARIDFAPLTGFMRGFVDLIFCAEDRWYLADYKSNFLGPRVCDYSLGALSLSMASHHYYLQYLVYIVALHRYLECRQSGYDYDRHMGGVFYLFVRGMSPGHPDGTGVFGDLPPLSLVLALSALFGNSASASEKVGA